MGGAGRARKGERERQTYGEGRKMKSASLETHQERGEERSREGKLRKSN